MRNLKRRIEQLERRTAASEQAGPAIFLLRSGVQLALDDDRCLEILAKSGYQRKGMALFNFCGVPPGLNGTQLERYLCRGRNSLGS